MVNFVWSTMLQREKKKSHLLSVRWGFMLKEIKGDRQRDERIDIFSSPFGSLWEEENYFKAAALMKEKGVTPDVFLQRWNQQYEWLKGREREDRETLFIFLEPNGGFLVRYESAIWQQWRKQWFSCQELWLVQHSTLISGVCIIQKAADVVR